MKVGLSDAGQRYREIKYLPSVIWKMKYPIKWRFITRRKGNVQQFDYNAISGERKRILYKENQYNEMRNCSVLSIN